MTKKTSKTRGTRVRSTSPVKKQKSKKSRKTSKTSKDESDSDSGSGAKKKYRYRTQRHPKPKENKDKKSKKDKDKSNGSDTGNYYDNNFSVAAAVLTGDESPLFPGSHNRSAPSLPVERSLQMYTRTKNDYVAEEFINNQQTHHQALVLKLGPPRRPINVFRPFYKDEYFRKYELKVVKLQEEKVILEAQVARLEAVYLEWELNQKKEQQV